MFLIPTILLVCFDGQGSKQQWRQHEDGHGQSTIQNGHSDLSKEIVCHQSYQDQYITCTPTGRTRVPAIC